MLKFKPKFFDVSKHPIIFVGQNPGPKHGIDYNNLVWEKGVASALLLEAIRDSKNIILTNICNYRELNEDTVKEGLMDFQKLVDDWQPTKIICLGNFAAEHVLLFIKTSAKIYRVPHPSFIVRFKKDRQLYINQIRKAMV